MRKFWAPIAMLSAWSIFSFVLSPYIISYAFNDLRPEFLLDLIAKHPEITEGYIQSEWFYMALVALIAWASFFVYTYLLKKKSFQEYAVGETSASTLGAIRMLVCGILLMSVIWEDVASTAWLPRSMNKPMGVMSLVHLIPGAKAFFASYTALSIFETATAILLFLGMIGLFTRKVLPLAAVGYLLVAGIMRQYSWFYHTGLLPLLMLFVLCFAPSADGWSVDGLIKKWKYGQDDSDTPKPIYAWVRYSIWMILAIPYTAAGLSKIRNGGLFWWDAINFKHIMLFCDVRPMEFDFDWGLLFVEAPDFLIEAMALVALLGEVFYGLVLFSKKSRLIFPIAMLIMHIGILFLQNILFFDLIILQVIFWDLNIPKQKFINYWSKRHPALTFSYPSENSFWNRVALLIKSLDLLERFTLKDDNTLKTAELTRGEKIYHGKDMLEKLSWQLPALWLLAPLVFIVIRLLKINLFSLVKSRLSSTITNLETPAAKSFSWLNSPKLAIYLLLVFTICWVFRVELFPLTAMQMFSRIRGNVIEYEIVNAHMASGEIVRAPIEESIGAMACSRYRKLIKKSFESEKHLKSCEELMTFSANIYNSKEKHRDKIVKMEVQRRAWDFTKEPHHPEFGQLVNNITFEISEPTYSPSALDKATP